MYSLFGNIEKETRYVNGNTMKQNVDNVFDQYFTKKELAASLVARAQQVLSQYEPDLDAYTWLEPSAGEGCFFDLLPPDRRIGIDIAPRRSDVIRSDYLEYSLPDKKLIVIGNPPFGHRGVMALNFINHSQKAEYVCFILPMFFESKGKGSVKYRVRGFNLLHSEKLPKNSFYLPESQKDVDVKCVFQIWSKNHKPTNSEFSWYNNRHSEPYTDMLKVVTVSLAKNRECGKRYIFDRKADFYVSSTFHEQTSIVHDFEQVKYKSGVAVIFTTQNRRLNNRILDIFSNIDWKDYASLATNSCYHIGKSNIFQVLRDNEEELNTYKNDLC
jgi:hypothetical protein